MADSSFLRDLKVSKAPALAFASVGFFWGSFAGLVPDLKNAIGASDGAFGLAMFFAAIGAICAMWLAPRLDARLGPRAMQGASLALALFFLLPGLASNVMVFACAMLLASAASGSLDVIMNMRVSQIETETGRTLMNLNHGMFSLAYALAALSAGLFREAGVAPLTVFALIMVLTLCLISGMWHAPSRTDEDDSGTYAPGLGWIIALGGGIILIAFMTEQATEAWSALHLERGLGAAPAQGAMGPAILGLTMGIGRLGAQVVLGRLPETRVIQISAMVSALGCYIAAGAQSVSIAYLGFAILGLGVSVLAPLAYSAVGKRVSEEARNTVITRISLIGYAGFFIGPPLMGGLSEAFGLHVSFLAICFGLIFISVILAPALGRKKTMR